MLAIDPHFQGYAKPWFSVQAVACTEITSSPYTPSDLDPSGPRINLKQGQTAGIRKTIPFRSLVASRMSSSPFVAAGSKQLPQNL